MGIVTGVDIRTNCCCDYRGVGQIVEVLMEKLEFGFAHGYTRALLDIKEQLPNLADDMKLHNVRFNFKSLSKALDCAIENRESLRDDPAAFVRCKEGGGFEVARDVRWRT